MEVGREGWAWMTNIGLRINYGFPFIFKAELLGAATLSTKMIERGFQKRETKTDELDNCA
jgi:hypothetical protein